LGEPVVGRELERVLELLECLRRRCSACTTSIGSSTDKVPEGYARAQPHRALFSEGRSRSVRHLGKGSRIREKMNAEGRAVVR